MSFGYKLGSGEDLDSLLNEGITTEGVITAKSLIGLIDKYNVEMPICEAVHDILYSSKSITETIKNLLSRPFGSELLQ